MLSDTQDRSSDLTRAKAAADHLLTRLPAPAHHAVYESAQPYIDVHFHDADRFAEWSAALDLVNDHHGFDLRDMAAWHTGKTDGFRVDLWLHGVTGADLVAEDLDPAEVTS